MAINELIKTEFKNLIEETFSPHHGIYTNKGTSLFETLEHISAVKASIVRGQDKETIAGHVFHWRGRRLGQGRLFLRAARHHCPQCLPPCGNPGNEQHIAP